MYRDQAELIDERAYPATARMNVAGELMTFDLIANMHAVIHGEVTGPCADILTALALTYTKDHPGLLKSIGPDEESPLTIAALTGEYAADPAVCHPAFQISVDFGLIGVDAVGDVLPESETIALAKRMGPCDCGRLTLDDHDLTRRALSGVAAANMTAVQGLLLAATDYAHRTFNCAGLSTLIRELTQRPRATFEPPALTALLDHVRAAHRAESGHAGHSSVPDANICPSTAASSMSELIPGY
ncbi:hypothetical protein N7925_35550 [Streptomyces sp. CA-278952]|uniref:hypothetical protein n=1 Tax=unclassified Streptomyces TaxID=2593676 RepID=UPI002242154E|nr:MULTISPECIES: hypothetical protein [unclassified Streptomyces]UZI33389.1 hypothetical protein OH133_37810 [Streptomyces sp. VB1]WDG33272.1 hypothetical protein N7925_35550 [Streptomyces sp. CA-278952]